MTSSISLNLDNELEDENEQPLTDAALLDWRDLIHAELHARGLAGCANEAENGAVTIAAARDRERYERAERERGK